MRSSAAVTLEGIPTVTIVDDHLVQVATISHRGLGVSELPFVTIPRYMIRKPTGTDPHEIRKWAEDNIDGIVNSLTRWQPGPTETVARPPRTVTVEGRDYQNAIDRMNRLYQDNRWSDGLPLVPPTEERVRWLLTGTDLPPAEVVARIDPSGGFCTTELIAVNAAMAGGRPEYMPVLIAAVRAMARPEFELDQIQTTMNPVTPVVIVNGPIARQIGINSSWGCLGPSSEFPAGGVIGRAIRLILMNVGGAIPGVVDMAYLGQPGKYTGLVFAEAEEVLPPGWNPLNVEMGFPRGTNTVTVYGVSGTTNMHIGSAGKGTKCAPLAVANFVKAPNGNYLYVVAKPKGKFGLLVMNAPKERVIRKDYEAFDSKDAIKRFLYEKVAISIEDAMLHWNCEYIESRTRGIYKCPLTRPIKAKGPDDFMVVCVAPASEKPYSHWCWMGCGHGGYTPVTEEIKLPSNWDELLKRKEA